MDKVLKSLCYYDKRNPHNDIDEEFGIHKKPREDNCYCDNCYDDMTGQNDEKE